MFKAFIIGLTLILNVQAGSASPFFLSSDPILKKNDAVALKDIETFVFLFFLQIDKSELDGIVDLFNQELSKVSRVVKKEIFTDQGIDIECFSNQRLQFSLAQLVDDKGLLLPILRAELSVNGLAEICSNKVLTPLNTKAWTLYLNKEKQTTLSALKTSVPVLLESFLADYIKVNGKDKKPTFLITYDASWWKAFDK